MIVVVFAFGSISELHKHCNGDSMIIVIEIELAMRQMKRAF